MKDIIPPEGYRLMCVGEYPNKGDLVYSIKSDQKRSNTTMTGSWKIYSIPTHETLIYARNL